MALLYSVVLSTYTFVTVNMQNIANIPNKSLARFKAISFVVEKYGIKGLSKWEKIKISRCFLTLPEDHIALYSLAICSWESQFYPRAKSATNDYGIAQFNLKTGITYLKLAGFKITNPEEAVKLLFKPEISIPCQYDHIADLYMLSKGNYKDMLYGYNHSKEYVDSVYNRTKIITFIYDSVYVAESSK